MFLKTLDNTFLQELIFFQFVAISSAFNAKTNVNNNSTDFLFELNNIKNKHTLVGEDDKKFIALLEACGKLDISTSHEICKNFNVDFFEKN